MFTTTKFYYIVFAGAMFFLFSCNAKKKLVEGAVDKNLSTSSLNKIISTHQSNFTFFHGKAKVNAYQNGTGMGVTAQIRMKKEAYLWMAVSKLGFEVARAYITPDSAFVIDRFHKEYYAEDLASYLDEYQIPFDFSELQGMFVGNAPLPNSKNVVSEFEGTAYKVMYKNNDRSSYVYVINAITKSLQSSIFSDVDQRTVASKFSNYNASNRDQKSPFLISHEIRDEKNLVELDINYSEMIFDVEKSVPFEIPSHYDRAQ